MVATIELTLGKPWGRGWAPPGTRIDETRKKRPPRALAVLSVQAIQGTVYCANCPADCKH